MNNVKLVTHYKINDEFIDKTEEIVNEEVDWF